MKRKRKTKLRNWPPSRGRRPRVRKPIYVIPEPKIEPIEMVPDRRRWMKPATDIERIVPAPFKLSKKSRRLRKRGRFLRTDMVARRDAERTINIDLLQHVSTIGQKLRKHDSWALVGGAEFVPRKVGKTRVRKGGRFVFAKRGFPAHASMRHSLPARPITFDLTYPLSKCARVTVYPYTVKDRLAELDLRRDPEKRMDVGYLLWQLARAYQRIYKSWKQYGVWGHAITDLWFECLKIDDNIGTVFIGS